MFMTPSSTNYLRPDIEYNQLKNNNVLPCELSSDVQLVSEEQSPIATSTGNGVIRLYGWLEAIFAIAPGQLICTLPTIYRPNKIYVINGTKAGSGVFSLLVFFIQTDGQIVSRGPGDINAGDTIILDGVVFLQNFTK